MDINIVSLLGTACITLCLGLVAYLRAPDRPSNRLFGVHAAVVAAWVLLTCGVMVAELEALSALMRALHIASLFVVATFVDFVWVFPDRLRMFPWKRRAPLYILALLFSLVAALPSLVRSVKLTSFGPCVEFGWPLAVFAIYPLTLVIHANLVLLHKLRTLRGVARVQTVYVFFGTLVCELIILTTNVLLPMVTGMTAYSRWGAVGYLIVIAAIAISIAKYRLWDLDGLTRKAAAGMLALAGLVPVAGSVIWTLGNQTHLWEGNPSQVAVLWMSIGAILGLFLIPTYHTFHGLVVRPLRAERDRIGHLISALGAAVVRAPADGSALLPILAETQRFFNCTLVSAYLRGLDGALRCAASVLPDEQPTAPSYAVVGRRLPLNVVRALNADQLTRTLDAGEIARFGALEESARTLAAMSDIGASVVTPLRWEGQTIGLLALGEKVSRDMYYGTDLDVLESVANHATIAVKSSELKGQILSEKERTEKVLAQMESGVVAVDSRKTILLVNAAACNLLGRQESELLGQSVRVLPRPLRDALHRALDAGVTSSGEKANLAQPAGSAERVRRLRVSCSTFLLRGPNGATEGGGVVFRDLSTEDALRRTEQEAERLRFIRAVSAGMAHEIRNPLVAIRTFAELLPTRLDDPEFRESFLQVARSEINRLEELVVQFMTLAKPTRLVRQPVDLPAFAQGVVTVLTASFEARKVRLTTNVAPSLPVFRADENRLHQAVLNLLMNALDATPEGGEIELTVAFAPGPGGDEPGDEQETADRSGEVVLRVWNSDSYIAPEDREHVFEPFWTRKATGTGLGLAICQTIADEHGGTIAVESNSETGTAFTLRLPLVVRAGADSTEAFEMAVSS
ncbi:PAS domain-containing protein [bacterium]|nr:PAS domain-containing protein [bacterium]